MTLILYCDHSRAVNWNTTVTWSTRQIILNWVHLYDWFDCMYGYNIIICVFTRILYGYHIFFTKPKQFCCEEWRTLVDLLNKHYKEVTRKNSLRIKTWNGGIKQKKHKEATRKRQTGNTSGTCTYLGYIYIYIYSPNNPT